MKIWELKSDVKSRMLTIDHNKGITINHPFYEIFDGSSKLQAWDVCYVTNYRKGRYTDFPSFRLGIPVFSRKTLDILGPYINNYVEFLPLVHEEMDFFAVNVINVIDCVDRQRSKVKTLISTGDSLGYEKIVFSSEKIPEHTLIFKVNGSLGIYVTDHFIELVNLHKLKGFKFIEVWNSEITDEMELEKQKQYKDMLDSIEKNKGLECTYDEAMEVIQSGKAVASGKWKMQRDDRGRLWLGQLGEDCKYHWLMPVYIPPVLLGYMWHEVERSSI